MEIAKMPRDRINHMLDLVLAAKEIQGINISIVVEKWGLDFGIWTNEPHEKDPDITYTVYHTNPRVECVHNQVREVYDPNLEKAEKHYKALMEELKNDLV